MCPSCCDRFCTRAPRQACSRLARWSSAARNMVCAVVSMVCSSKWQATRPCSSNWLGYGGHIIAPSHGRSTCVPSFGNHGSNCDAAAAPLAPKVRRQLWQIAGRFCPTLSCSLKPCQICRIQNSNQILRKAVFVGLAISSLLEQLAVHPHDLVHQTSIHAAAVNQTHHFGKTMPDASRYSLVRRHVGMPNLETGTHPALSAKSRFSSLSRSGYAQWMPHPCLWPDTTVPKQHLNRAQDSQKQSVGAKPDPPNAKERSATFMVPTRLGFSGT